MSTTILVNCTNSTYEHPTGSWNAAPDNAADLTVTAPPAVLIADCIDSTGLSTGISLSTVALWRAALERENQATSDQFGWPEQVWDTHWQVDATDTGGLTIAGLTEGDYFTIKLAAEQFRTDRPTDFEITDIQSNPISNEGLTRYTSSAEDGTVNEQITLTGTVPSDGKIVIDLTIVDTISVMNGFELTLISLTQVGAVDIDFVVDSTITVGIPSGETITQTGQNNYTFSLDSIWPDPPNITLPTATNITPASCIPTCFTDGENGTMGYVIVLSGTATPSATQILAGQDGNGDSAVVSDTKSVTEMGTQIFPMIAGLDSITDYDLHFTHIDDDDSASAVASVAFTTLGANNTIITLTAASRVGDVGKRKKRKKL